MGRLSAQWKFCPACRSYRFTWSPKTRKGRCQDCGHEVGHRRSFTLVVNGVEAVDSVEP